MTDYCEKCGTSDMEDSPNGSLCLVCDALDEEENKEPVSTDPFDMFMADQRRAYDERESFYKKFKPKFKKGDVLYTICTPFIDFKKVEVLGIKGAYETLDRELAYFYLVKGKYGVSNITYSIEERELFDDLEKFKEFRIEETTKQFEEAKCKFDEEIEYIKSYKEEEN